IGLHHHRCEALILASLELDQRCPKRIVLPSVGTRSLYTAVRKNFGAPHMNPNMLLRKPRAIVPAALFLLAVTVSSSASAEPLMSTRITSHVLPAMAVLVRGNGLNTCVPLLYEKPVLGPNLRLNTSGNYQLYAMSTTNCQAGTALAGLYGSVGFIGSKSGTFSIDLSNSGFSYS
ncbi:hypothetical protein, partial [Xanthomonas axonopodis]